MKESSTSAPPARKRPDPTPEQRAAIELRDVSIALSAGAGCGKTAVLTRRFLSHLDPSRGDGELGRLVAITFTERAAREMRERIRGACRDLVRDGPEAQVDHWLRIVRELDAARITTIHSFCASLLRAHAVEAGIDPKFTLLDETTGGAFRRHALMTALHGMLAARDPDAVEFVLEHGLERSGALLDRLVLERYQIDLDRWRGVSEAELVRLWEEQWRSAAVPRLMRELAASDAVRRAIAVLEEHVPDHEVMRERRLMLLADLTRLADTPDPAVVLARVLDNARVQGGGGKGVWPDEEVYAEVQEALSALRDAIGRVLEQLAYDPVQVAQAARAGLQALRITGRAGLLYDESRRDASVLDFDDLLLRARDLLSDQKNGVRRRLAAGIELLMVDEFQDTDPVQAGIVRMLCGDALTGGRLFVVGDSKQSIYRFRRAEPSVFHDLRKEIPESGRLPLSTNFRSQPAILNFVNALFDGALEDDYEPLRPFIDKQLSSEPCVEFLFATADATADDEQSGDESADSRRAREADWIARRLKSLLFDGVPRVRDHDQKTGNAVLRPAQPRDVALLFRAMTDIRQYEEALRRYGLDYYVVGGRAFFAQQEIFDVVNLCRYLDDMDDEVALVGVLRSPFFSLSDDALYALSQPAETGGARRRTITAALADDPPAWLSEEQQRRVRHAGAVLCELRGMSDRLSIAQLLNLAIERTGYDAALLTEFLGSRKLANLRKLIDLARDFDRPGLFTLADFVDRLVDSLGDETREPLAATHPESSNVIRLMSIHQSKGLEFPIVVVADMDRRGNDVPPLARLDPQLGPLVSLTDKFGMKRENLGLRLHRVLEQEQSRAESLRLLYVATTRAADHLILSANLKAPGQVTHEWMKLLARRFDLHTGQPRQSPTSKGESILVKYARRLPQILVHHATPEPGKTSHGREAKRLPLERIREILNACPPAELPRTLIPIPVDFAARTLFSVSEIETAEAALAAGGARAIWSGDPRVTRWAAKITAPEPEAGLNADDATLLGTIVHAAIERIDHFRAASTDAAALVAACCGAAGRPVRDAVRSVANSAVSAYLASGLPDELTAAKRLYRELEFLVRLEAVNATVAGTIDCLFETTEGEWIILDYKTGSRHLAGADPDAIAKHAIAKYGIQLGLYCLAVESWMQKRPERVELVYLDAGFRLSLNPDDAWLTSVAERTAKAIGALRTGAVLPSESRT